MLNPKICHLEHFFLPQPNPAAKTIATKHSEVARGGPKAMAWEPPMASLAPMGFPPQEVPGRRKIFGNGPDGFSMSETELVY